MKKRLVYFVASTILILSLILGLAKISQTRMKVTSVRCELDQHECPPDLITRLEHFKQQPLLFVDVETQLATVLGQGTFYRVESIKKRLPSELIIRLSSEQPLFQIQSAGNIWLIFKDAQARSVAQLQSGLMVFNVSEPFLILNQEGTYLQEQKFNWLRGVHQELQKQVIPFQEILILDDKTLEVRLPNGQKALIDSENSPQQIMKLKLILDQYGQQEVLNQHPVIDLRFELPVLKTP